MTDPVYRLTPRGRLVVQLMELENEATAARMLVWNLGPRPLNQGAIEAVKQLQTLIGQIANMIEETQAADR